jgi:hypothetical protein
MDDLQNKYYNNSGHTSQLLEHPEWRFCASCRDINPFHDRIPQLPNESHKIITFDDSPSQSRLIPPAQSQLTVWSFFCKAYTRAFTQQNIRAGWAATGIYPLNPQYVPVRILKPKRKSEVKSSPKTPASGQGFRKTYGRLKNAGHVNKKAANVLEGVISQT